MLLMLMMMMIGMRAWRRSQGLFCDEIAPSSCDSPPCAPVPTCNAFIAFVDGCPFIPCEVGSICVDSVCICDPDIAPGDANNDGQVQVNDVVALIGGVLDSNAISSCIFSAVDVVKDGTLTVEDVVVTVDIILA